MGKLVPTAEFFNVIEPHYPKAGDGANCAARSGKKSELFWGGIDNRMITNNHCLSIYLYITTVISNGYFAIRHFYERFRLRTCRTSSVTHRPHYIRLLIIHIYQKYTAQPQNSKPDSLSLLEQLIYSS